MTTGGVNKRSTRHLAEDQMLHGSDRASNSSLDPLAVNTPSAMWDESEGPEPNLLVPIERTPLPEIDQAMPFLSLFPAVVSRGRGRYKIGVLKSLQGEGSGRWKIRQIQDATYWLDPPTVAELVRDLRDADVLSYDPVRMTYRLTPSGRVVSALISALTMPDIDARRIIKYLSLAMSIALVGGAASAAKASFASAVSVLRADLEELQRLIEDDSRSALREAASLINTHLEDMRELLDEHERFRIASAGDAEFLKLQHDALALTAELGNTVGDVALLLAGRANEVMRGGAPIDRSDVRDQKPADLSRLLAGLAGAPAFAPFISASVAFAALAEKVGLNRPGPPPLPEPLVLRREDALETQDFTRDFVDELAALRVDTTAADIIARDNWATSVRRHHAFIDAYNRRVKSLPDIEFSVELDEPGRAGVGRISKTTFKVKNA